MTSEPCLTSREENAVAAPSRGSGERIRVANRGSPEARRNPSAAGPSSVTLVGLQIAGDRARVTDWLGLPADYTSTEVEFTFVAPHGTPGLLSCTFQTPGGLVVV